MVRVLRIGLENHAEGSGGKGRRLNAGNVHGVLPAVLPPSRIDFPTQAQRQGQSARGLPGVLAIERRDVVMARGHVGGTLDEVYRRSQQEIGHGVFRNAAIKGKRPVGSAAIGMAETDAFPEPSPLDFMRAMHPIPVLRHAVIHADALIDGWRCGTEASIYRGGRETVRWILVLEVGCAEVRQAGVH